MKRLCRGFVAGIAVVSALACTPSGPQAPSVTLRLSPTPATVGGTRLLVDIADSTGTVVSGAKVELVARLGDAGARVSQATALESQAGRYVVDSFEFTAPGEWSIEVLVTSSTGWTTSVTRTVRVVGGGPS